MILKFNDATELQIQSAEPVGQGLRILTIGTTPEQLREIFSDKVKTKVMKVEERGQLIATYENYTEYDHTEEYPGQICAGYSCGRIKYICKSGYQTGK